MCLDKGADHYVAMNDPATHATAPKCHIILNTVSAKHDANSYMPLLAKSGTLVQLGLVVEPHTVSQFPLMLNRQSISGSLIGGIKANEEILALCAKHNILPEIEIVLSDRIDEIYNKLNNESNPDGVRYVLDIQGSIAAG